MATKSIRWLTGAVIVLGCLLRWLHLDADPHYYGWWGYIFDEGRWVEQARVMALRGEAPSSFGANAMVAPVFEVATTLVFMIAGASHFTSRLLPALAGSALLILVWLWLRPRVSASATLLGVTLVAFAGDLVVLSRVAVPEMPAMLMSTVAFLVLITNPPSRLTLSLAGLITAAALGVKITTLFTAGVFVIVALSLRPPGSRLVDRLRDAGWFALGLLGPALVLAPIVLFLASRVGVNVVGRLHGFLNFFGIREPYELFSIVYQAIDSPVILTGCLALWLAGLAAIATDDHDSGELRWLRACAAWAGPYIVIFTVQAYFPSRYRMHVLIPFALLTALSTSLLQRDGFGRATRAIAGAGPWRRAVLTGFVALPAGIQFAALITPGTSLVGIDPERLSTRMVLTAAGWVATTAALWRPLARPSVLPFVAAFSLLAGGLHFLHWVVDPFAVEFVLRQGASAPGRALFLVVVAGLAWLAVRWLAAPSARAWPAVATAAAFALAWLVHLWPGLADPRFTARDASAVVGELLEGQGGICQSRAESLFIGTALSYEPLDFPIDRQRPPSVIVAEIPLLAEDAFLHEHYAATRLFEIYVPPDHAWPPRPSPLCGGPGQCFAVFHPRNRETLAGLPGRAAGQLPVESVSSSEDATRRR